MLEGARVIRDHHIPMIAPESARSKVKYQLGEEGRAMRYNVT